MLCVRADWTYLEGMPDPHRADEEEGEGEGEGEDEGAQADGAYAGGVVRRWKERRGEEGKRRRGEEGKKRRKRRGKGKRV